MIQAPPSKVKIFDSLPLVPVSFKLGLSPSPGLFPPWSSMGSSSLTVQSARDVVLQHCQQIAGRQPVESVALLESFQRVLAETVSLDSDQPPFARSMRDGFALRTEDVQSVPVSLRCIGEVRAGEMTEAGLTSGEAIQIMTGAPVPVGDERDVPAGLVSRQADRLERLRGPLELLVQVDPLGEEF